MIESQNPELSIRQQCELLGLNRTTLYYTPAQESALNFELMRCIDAQYLRTPFYGYRRMTVCLRRQGYAINAKRIQRLMHIAVGTGGTPLGPVSQAAHDGDERTASHLSVPAAQFGDHTPQSSAEHRHHLYSDAARLHVPGGRHRLVQPLHSSLAAFELSRRAILFGSPGASLMLWTPRDLHPDRT